MVTSTSAATQAAENEKRKKQTMEKVKVNHVRCCYIILYKAIELHVYSYPGSCKCDCNMLG